MVRSDREKTGGGPAWGTCLMSPIAQECPAVPSPPIVSHLTDAEVLAAIEYASKRVRN